MEARITIVGNLLSDAKCYEKEDYTLTVFRVAANKSKDETVIYTCFDYHSSENKINRLKKGSLVSVYGTPITEIDSYKLIDAKDEFIEQISKAETKTDLNRIVNEYCSVQSKISTIDFSIIIPKK